MKIVTFRFADDGAIPNHPTLPLLVYKNALKVEGSDPASIAEAAYARSGWGGTWRNGIFDFHHYHSTAHEALAIVRGRATVLIGGEEGERLEVSAGDVMVLPAGTGHKRLSSSTDLLVVGAYPAGQQWDLCRGEAGERPQVLQNIREVPLPNTDPIFGDEGPLIQHWLV